MIKHKEGNLLDMFDKGEFDIIMHQCNCFYLGAGIADQICKRYGIKRKIEGLPLDYYGNSEFIHIGDVQQNKYIVNLYTQFQGGPCDSKGLDSFQVRSRHLEYALEQVKSQIIDFNEIYNVKMKIGIPLIASGIAADQSKKDGMSDLEYFIKYIQPVFEKVFSNDEVIDITVVTYKP